MWPVIVVHLKWRQLETVTGKNPNQIKRPNLKVLQICDEVPPWCVEENVKSWWLLIKPFKGEFLKWHLPNMVFKTISELSGPNHQQENIALRRAAAQLLMMEMPSISWQTGRDSMKSVSRRAPEEGDTLNINTAWQFKASTPPATDDWQLWRWSLSHVTQLLYTVQFVLPVVLNSDWFCSRNTSEERFRSISNQSITASLVSFLHFTFQYT